jgi:hypothetical protein
MRRTMTMVGLAPVLGGLMLLGGCATLESDGYWDSSYPAYSRHLYVDEYRYRNPDGLIVVYDPGPSLYSVVSVPGIYWHDGYYYRKHRGHWERSRYHRGPWGIHRHEPPRVRVRHEPPAARPAPIAVPERRDHRPPVYRIHDREPYGRPPADRDRGRLVGRPPEQRPDPGRGIDPPRTQNRHLPGPQSIPWVGVPERQNPPRPVAAPVRRVPPAGQGVRPIGVNRPPPDRGRPSPAAVTHMPDRPRPGPVQRQTAPPVQPAPNPDSRRQVRDRRESPGPGVMARRSADRDGNPEAGNPEAGIQRHSPTPDGQPRRRFQGTESGWPAGPERARF